jgi:hypothetical protein
MRIDGTTEIGSDPTDANLGRAVGNYRLTRLLGEGGMGSVYLAEHPRFERRMVVKLLRRSPGDDQQMVERFLNDGRAANAIRHPNIIDVVDMGVLADTGTPYLVMEYLEGESLGARLRRLGPLDLADALDFADQTAGAVGAAHAKQVIHRDLKPDNLFLIADPNRPGRERVKVLDFGIAKLSGEVDPGVVRTQTGAFLGTPTYMSPEQCRGGSVDARSDVYALGIIVYEMLCGQPPFVSPGFGEVMSMHLTAAPAPPRLHNADIPEALEALILRAIAKEPERRFASMAELQEALLGLPEARPGVGVLGTAIRVEPPKLESARVEATRVEATRVEASGVEASGVEEPRGRASRGEARITAPQTAPPLGSGKLIAVAVLAALGLGGGAAYLNLRTARTDATAPVDPRRGQIASDEPRFVADAAVAKVEVPPVATIAIQLGSVPAGARIRDAASGEVLGVTPLRLARPRGPGTLKIVVEARGYRPARLELPLDADSERSVRLDALPRKPPGHLPI